LASNSGHLDSGWADLWFDVVVTAAPGRPGNSRRKIEVSLTTRLNALSRDVRNRGSSLKNKNNSNVSGGGNCEAISDGAGVSL
jgi:hypothetical protein